MAIGRLAMKWLTCVFAMEMSGGAP